MMRWLKIDRVAAIHQLQLAEHGGGSGIRDVGLLESALARPENIAAYEPDADVATLAAAYAFGIIKNHPFIDGNKRTGYVVMETFPVINGYQLTATPQDKYITFLNLAEGTFTEDNLTKWLRERLTAV
jgi:death-on-curing protein